mgnify:CR=1 FL=1
MIKEVFLGWLYLPWKTLTITHFFMAGLEIVLLGIIAICIAWYIEDRKGE